MYALSPWIESRSSVSMERAPRVGPRGDRIIKTHFGVKLCPYAESARYIYVTRHPVACFASCVDFVRMLGGPLAPPLPELVDWFCSDAMWWRSWPEHVDGWWQWQLERPNVLFVHYEAMLDDLPAAVEQVSKFLEVDLLPAEHAEVVRKSGYDYMKAHEEVFEMSPPSFLTRDEGSFLQSGRKDRDQLIEEAQRTRIARFCRERLEGASYPLARFYPDVADA
jgi:aryl sulfotransferase